MGKLHDDWKAAKAKVKLINTATVFKKNLGDRLNQFEKAFAVAEKALAPGVGTPAQRKAAFAALKAVVVKAQEAFLAYEDLIREKGKQLRGKFAKTTDAKEKAKIKAEGEEWIGLALALVPIHEAVTGSLFVMGPKV